MGEDCLVICGEWMHSREGHWDFVVDKQRMTRVVSLRSDIGLVELKHSVLSAFFDDGGEGVFVTLSYWPPNSTELVTGITTPPVMITTESSIGYFLKHVRVNSSLNLFAKFDGEARLLGNIGVEGGCNGLRTPVSRTSNSNDFFCGLSGYKTPFPTRGGSREYESGFRTPVSTGRAPPTDDNESDGAFSLFKTPIASRKREFVVDEGSVNAKKTNCLNHEFQREPVQSNDDEELIKHAEFVEEIMKSESGNGKLKENEDLDSEGSVYTDSDENEGVGINEGDVMTHEYDKEFWEPFLNETFGGSDAAEVMCEPVDPSDNRWDGINGPREIRCTTNDAFDHTVLVGGSIPSNYHKKEAESFGWAGMDGAGSSNLGTVDDEEFDIPPMFDDTLYENADIPDLDLADGEDVVRVGKVYPSKEDCKIALAIYAIKEMFHFRQTRTKRDSFVLSCVDSRCDFRIFAKEIRDSCYYEIKKAHLEHTCDIETRKAFKQKASSRVIAAVYKAKFGDPVKGPKASQLQRLVLEDLRVNASYMKCYRAIESGIMGVRGSDDDSYIKLPEYLYMLKLANPGTVTEMETEIDEDGLERFKFVFLSFGASLAGFRRLRHLIVLDGTHLGGRFKGVLLTASGQDANFQVFPLAFAVVDSENDVSWTWFLRNLGKLLADSKNLTIISDRHNGIKAAKKAVYPKAFHGVCIVHVQRNVTSRFKNKGLSKLVGAAAYAFTIADFRERYGKIKGMNAECARYLDKIGTTTWSRAYFGGDRYNLMTSNIAETLNKALSEGRNSPIIELLTFIQSMMTRWFAARRKKAAKHRGIVTPEVDKVMTKNMGTTKGSKINCISSWSIQIIGRFGSKHHVVLNDRKCNCMAFQKLKIPCGHALLAADTVGLPYASLVGECYKTSTWVETYEGVINPEANPKDVDIPPEVSSLVLFPPKTRRPSGRPRELRIPSTGEIPGARVKKVVPNKCGRCRLSGHNRSRCTNPI